MRGDILSVCKNTNGTVTVSAGSWMTVVDVRTKAPKEKLEAVRAAILMSGYVYTEKVEKKVRNLLGA
jgi:hypothetical protein